VPSCRPVAIDDHGNHSEGWSRTREWRPAMRRRSTAGVERAARVEVVRAAMGFGAPGRWVGAVCPLRIPPGRSRWLGRRGRPRTPTGTRSPGGGYGADSAIFPAAVPIGLGRSPATSRRAALRARGAHPLGQCDRAHGDGGEDESPPARVNDVSPACAPGGGRSRPTKRLRGAGQPDKMCVDKQVSLRNVRW